MVSYITNVTIAFLSNYLNSVAQYTHDFSLSVVTNYFPIVIFSCIVSIQGQGVVFKVYQIK